MKLSLDALKERAGAVASNDLLATISGGTNNDCHDSTPTVPAESSTVKAPAPIIYNPPLPSTPTISSPIKFTF